LCRPRRYLAGTAPKTIRTLEVYMSNYYGGSELLYSRAGAATTTTPTAGAVSLIGSYPAIKVPANYMRKLGEDCSSLRLKMSGQLTATATIPTWLFGVAISSAQPPVFPTLSAANTLAATAAVTPSAGTGIWAFFDIDITLSAVALGAASTVETTGTIDCPNFPAPNFITLPANNVSSANANWESDLQYFIWPYLTLGAATAGNTFTMRMVKLFGDN
jgi:hypothetical protein